MRVGRSTAVALIVAVGLVALPSPGLAQDAPKTAWGAPESAGGLDFRTITPLQRPEDLGDKAFPDGRGSGGARAGRRQP